MALILPQASWAPVVVAGGVGGTRSDDDGATRKGSGRMPKPVLPKDVSLDMRVGKLASLLIAAKLEELSRYADLAMAGDVEGIHDTRVAVKRLREGMRVFRRLMPARHRERTMPLVEELNDALGRVRDPDVMTEHAQWVLEQAPEARDAIDTAIARWAAGRERDHAALLRVWQRMKKNDSFYARMDKLVDRLARRKKDINRLPVASFAYLAVTARMEVVAERLQAAIENPAPDVLHCLRIGVKRLKYTMEPFLPLLPGLKKPYRVVSDAQEALGLTHDFDVLEEAMAAALEAQGVLEPGNGQMNLSGAGAALEAVKRRRAGYYDETLELMERLATREWRNSVLHALD